MPRTNKELLGEATRIKVRLVSTLAVVAVVVGVVVLGTVSTATSSRVQEEWRQQCRVVTMEEAEAAVACTKATTTAATAGRPLQVATKIRTTIKLLSANSLKEAEIVHMGTNAPLPTDLVSYKSDLQCLTITKGSKEMVDNLV